MKWYYADEGRQVGPVEESALDELVTAGSVRGETLVWHEGMAEWQPLSTARPGSGSASIPGGPAAAAQTYCVECGHPFPQSEVVMISGAPVCALCKPAYLQRLRESGQAIGQRRYAGFWIRFVARVMDAVILGIAGMIIRLPFMTMLGLRSRGPGAITVLPAVFAAAGLLALLNIAIAVAYEVYFVSTKGATPGKQILGLKIIRSDGGPVSANLAFGRYFAQWVSAIILMIGYIMAGFDSEKRALHDRICNTRVIYAR